MFSQYSKGSEAAAYTCTTCFPRGASEGSNREGSNREGIEMMYMFSRAVIPRPQSKITLWWQSRSLGMPSPSMPKCKCTKDPVAGMASRSLRHASKPGTASSKALEGSGSRARVSHTGALLMTPSRARINTPPPLLLTLVCFPPKSALAAVSATLLLALLLLPRPLLLLPLSAPPPTALPAVRTPTARPVVWSTTISDTAVLSRTSLPPLRPLAPLLAPLLDSGDDGGDDDSSLAAAKGPFFGCVTPRTSAATTASEPPSG
mmetsp:Transcript_53589/g.106322  ORF Transcript_53589/g.106322 Transcript_53589/m.106322 type:complete len:261 (-) Transcript_53589:464-1246(-)